MTEAIASQDVVTNGVNVTALFDTISAIKGAPEIAEFKFRASNVWFGGGHNQSIIQGFHGACVEDMSRNQPFVLDADEPRVLLGRDSGANPVEFVLHALVSCLTTSMVYHAAARGLTVSDVRSELEGDIDIRGFLGLAPEVRKGYRAIRVRMRVKSDATGPQLMQCARFSPVYEMISRALPVDLSIEHS